MLASNCFGFSFSFSFILFAFHSNVHDNVHIHEIYVYIFLYVSYATIFAAIVLRYFTGFRGCFVFVWCVQWAYCSWIPMFIFCQCFEYAVKRQVHGPIMNLYKWECDCIVWVCVCVRVFVWNEIILKQIYRDVLWTQHMLPHQTDTKLYTKNAIQ